TVLLVSRSSPDLRLFNDAAAKVGMSGGATQSGYQPIVLPSDRLPKKWIDYSTLDLAMVSAKELEQMPAASREAIVTWTLAGGNLFVYGVEGDREDSGVLKRLLDLDHRPPHGAEWRKPKPEERNLEAMNDGMSGQSRWIG